MQKIKRNIPNAITCGNLLCGCLALVKAFEGDLVWAAYLVGIAVVLDFLDGFTARLLKVSSAIGKDLDSLADMVTFGVVPGVVMFKLIDFSIFYYESFFNSIHYVRFAVFIIPIFSAIRLAKFNNDIRQTNSFIGLPTPANAIFICSLPLILFQQYNILNARGIEICHQDYQMYTCLENIMSPTILIIISFVLSFLLVAPLPLFALKFKSFGWKRNEIRYTFLILSVILLGIFQFVGIPLIIILYILLSVVNNLVTKK